MPAAAAPDKPPPPESPLLQSITCEEGEHEWLDVMSDETVMILS